MSPIEHTSADSVVSFSEPFQLESGESLEEVQVAYRTWGRLADDGGNAVIVCHALTGSADAESWWRPLFGPGHTLDPSRDFIVCSNVLGSCYGTTGPTSRRPGTSESYGPDFPSITVRDLVHLQAKLIKKLGVTRIQLVLGGSLGGMQVLEWALLYPDLVRAIAPMATSGRHSPWCIGWSEAQRQAIYADPNWRGGRYNNDELPSAGLAVARMVAMCSYRSRTSFDTRFGRDKRNPELFEIESYLHYQGQKLVQRFDANTYVTLTRAMDTHDVARGRGDYAAVLRSLRTPAFVVSIDSDVLYLPDEQEELATLMPNGQLARLASPNGHDAFLTDAAILDRLLVSFRAELEAPRALDGARSNVAL